MKTMEIMVTGLGLDFTPNTILKPKHITTFNMTGTGASGDLTIMMFGNCILTILNTL